VRRDEGRAETCKGRHGVVPVLGVYRSSADRLRWSLMTPVFGFGERGEHAARRSLGFALAI
jgi:hypothetical protein